MCCVDEERADFSANECIEVGGEAVAPENCEEVCCGINQNASTMSRADCQRSAGNKLGRSTVMTRFAVRLATCQHRNDPMNALLLVGVSCPRPGVTRQSAVLERMAA